MIVSTLTTLVFSIFLFDVMAAGILTLSLLLGMLVFCSILGVQVRVGTDEYYNKRKEEKEQKAKSK